MSDCIFCKIIKGEIPVKFIYEDENVVAFNDVKPMAPIHVLILPKVHIESLKEINEENVDIISSIHLAAIKIAKDIGIYDEGFRIINNCGENGGQTVMHLHYHLLGGKALE